MESFLKQIESKIFDFFYIQKKDFVMLCISSAVLVFADLFTKHIVFEMNKPFLYVNNLFNIVKAKNFGISFGMFSDEIAPRTIIITVVCVAIISYLFSIIKQSKNYTKPNVFKFSVFFVIGGAIGNIVDRLQNGFVRDFLDFHINDIHWPAFNLADTFVCIGVGLLVLSELVFKKPENKKSKRK